MRRESCAALDQDGKRCRRHAVRIVQYHGEHELYGYFNEPWPSWVRVALCDRHSLEPRKPKPEAGRGAGA